MNILDAHKKLASDLGLDIEYIALPTIVYSSLTNEIIDYAGMDLANTELAGIKKYKDTTIKAHEVDFIKVAFLPPVELRFDRTK